jgi:hypothetical protein
MVLMEEEVQMLPDFHTLEKAKISIKGGIINLFIGVLKFNCH